MKIQLSDRFNYSKLFRFTLPSIVMMIFTSIYGVVDGFFVSNFVGKTPFAAVNFIMPVLMLFGGIGFMFGTGGGAFIAKTLGEGKKEKAQEFFTLLVYAAAGCGIILTIFGLIFIRQIASLLGAEGEMLENCVLYARILLIATPFFVLQFAFQSFFIVAEKPQIGLIVTVAAGVTNMVLDALFMAVFPWGLAGAAAASALSQVIAGMISILYFACPNTSLLRFTKFHMDTNALVKSCINGSSELMSNISMSLVGILYNIQLIRYAGEDGVSAYGVLMYVNMIFLAIFIGYSTGVSPVISYHYGAQNLEELKSLRKKSFNIIGVSSFMMFIAAEILASPLSSIFVSYDKDLFDMTVKAFQVYSFMFLFAGLAIFGSAFFTALNNGVISAIISFLRTLVFQVIAVLAFPLIWGIEGIWISVVVAEAMAVVVTVIFLIGKQKNYHY